MDIDFDPNKDAINRQKHHISLGEAARIEWDTAVIWPDDRYPYGENRMRGLGYIGLQLHYVAFVDHEIEGLNEGDIESLQRRVISLRKANKMEHRYYASA